MAGGHQRAVARELQRAALAAPLERAPTEGADRGYFRSIDRETTWGLTLNK